MRPTRLLGQRVAWVSTATTVLGLLIARQVRAGADELAASVGQPLLAYAHSIEDDGLRTLVVNGARLRMRTGRTRDSIDQVLDTQGAPCGLEPKVRTSRADQGFIGCIEPPAGVSLVERLRAFGATGDLAALGELRVTWAMREGDETRYVAMASEGSVELARMFPATQDAPGVDVAGIPRPPDAQRTLSTWQDHAEPMLVSYRSARPIGDIEREYTGLLTAGKQRVERAPLPEPDGHALVIRDGSRTHLALLARDGEGTLISIIALANDATEGPAAR